MSSDGIELTIDAPSGRIDPAQRREFEAAIAEALEMLDSAAKKKTPQARGVGESSVETRRNYTAVPAPMQAQSGE